MEVKTGMVVTFIAGDKQKLAVVADSCIEVTRLGKMGCMLITFDGERHFVFLSEIIRIEATNLSSYINSEISILASRLKEKN